MTLRDGNRSAVGYLLGMLFGSLLLLGDSLTAGARAEVGGHAGVGYPEHLAAILTATTENEWQPLNKGISGQTIRQIADRAPTAFREVVAYAGPRWAVFLAGTNDAKHPGVPLDEWEMLYRQSVGWGRRAAVPLALCTFPPVVAGSMPAFGPNVQAWLDHASERVRRLVAELDGKPSPVVLVELSDMPTSLLCDGVHLTPVGYRAMAIRVADALRFIPVRTWEDIIREATEWSTGANRSRVGRLASEGELCELSPRRARKSKKDREAEKRASA